MPKQKAKVTGRKPRRESSGLKQVSQTIYGPGTRRGAPKKVSGIAYKGGLRRSMTAKRL